VLTIATGGTGECLVKWHPEAQGIGWWKAYEQNDFRNLSDVFQFGLINMRLPILADAVIL
jgi:hypothetical protein